MRLIEGIKFYTVEDIAELLSVSIHTVRNYIKTGKLRGKRIGKPVYITDAELKRFLLEPAPVKQKRTDAKETPTEPAEPAAGAIK